MAWLLLPVLLGGCPHLPELRMLPPGPDADQLAARCAAAAPDAPFSAVHALEMEVTATGASSALLGVTTADPAALTAHSVLLTPEGMTLFEGRRDPRGRVTVAQALPPLDRPAFGQGLFADVALIFFTPRLPPAAVGHARDGAPVCRYRVGASTVDLALPPSGGFRLLDYGHGASPRRVVEARGPLDRGLAPSMTLRVAGLGGYRMRFDLVRREVPDPTLTSGASSAE